MGATRNTGYLENLIAYDASNNVAIATTAIDNAFKITMGGSVKMTGALSGTSATFSGNVIAGGSTDDTSGGLYSNVALNGTTYSRYSLLTGGTARARFQFDGTNTSLVSTSNGGKLQLVTTAASAMEFFTNDTLRLTISSTGAATFSNYVTSLGYSINNGAGRGGFYTYNAVVGSGTDYSVGIYSEGEIFLASGGSATKRLVMTTGGNVGIGTSSPDHKLDIYGALCVDAFGDPAANYITLRNQFAPSQSGGMGFMALDHSGSGYDGLGCYGHDGISFYTAQSERMRITSGGDVYVTASSNIASERMFIEKSGTALLGVNRLDSDGGLVRFYQDSTEEGNITVSGSTVSYNGGHLSRWSQTSTNTRIDGLLKGTVMSNLDQMAEWINPETGEPYANEQLNCMKVSDVEGDINVAGVFVNWDNDDTVFTNDMNIAMTGDMIIRIGKDVVVERGQLLMSAGDGTAKPQGDDIIRDKTIAKVTSNHVTCVYEDGSYCVPCVLMAC